MTINDQTPAPASDGSDVLRARSAMASAIRERMGLLGLNGKELSDRSGVATSSLHNYLKGRRSVPVESLFAIADAMDVNAGALVDRASEIMREDA